MGIPGASAVRRRALPLVLVALSCPPALAAAAPANGAGASPAVGDYAAPARILQPPRGHAIVTGRSFGIVAALPRDARLVHARIDERGLTGLFKRRRDGRYAARVPTRLADGPGFHFLLIAYADASGRHSLGRELVVARGRQHVHHPRRGRRLLTARIRGHRAAGVARLHLSAPRADQWSVRVNGRDVSDRFADHAGFLRDGSLSASTGLHQGRNRVAVVAARDDGTRAVRRFTVRVRPHTPIPDAGRPRRVGAGERVRLGSPGGAAEPAHPGDRLEHTWTILTAPKRSEARLRHPHAARPSIRPDVRGTYRIADRVTERTRAGRLVGRSARDVVEITATPAYVPPIGEPIETFASGPEEKLGIKLGGGFFALEGGPGAIQLLMIDPTTLTTWTKTFGSAEEATGAIQSEATNAGTIVVAQAREMPVEADGGELAWLEILGEEIGGIDNAFRNLTDGREEARISFSAIGVKGVAEGQGWINGVAGAPGNAATGVLRGYIAPNYELTEDPEAATYAFMPSTYFSYDTNTTGVGEGATSVTAQVGPTRVSGSVPSGQVGFLVAELDAGDLSLRSSKSFAIAAAGSGEASNRGEVEALAAWLEESQFDPGALVLVQSIGTLPGEPPAPPKSKGSEEEERYKLVEAWARAARAIAYLGGHEGTFLSGGGGGYSFLGGNALPGAGVPAAEHAIDYLGYAKPAVVRLAGTLQLGHTGTLVPATNTPISTPGATSESDPAAVGNFELPLIAYQPATPWPYEPGSANEDAAVVAAGHYISEKICDPACGSEVRRLYPTPNFDLTQLLEGQGEGEEFHCPGGEEAWEGTAFSSGDCEEALAEFEREYRMVSRLDDYFSTSSDGFLYPLNAVIGEQQAGLEAIGNDVEAAVQADSEAGVDIEWLVFAQTFALIGEALPGISAASTLIDSGLNLASSFAVDSSGESVFRAETEVDDAVAQVMRMASSQEEAIGNLKAIVVSDYGKLNAMAANTGGRYPQWNLPSDWSAVKEELGFGLRGAFYLTFLPSLGGGYVPAEGEESREGFSDVVLPQNVCTSFEYSKSAPKAPECGVGDPPEWTTVPPRELSEKLVCWYVGGEQERWETEIMGGHWAGGEYVVPEANAIWEWAVNPYYPLAPGGTYMLAYSPRWRVAISELEPFSSSEAPFPASVAREISGKPEAGNLAAGLPRWALFESLPSKELGLCPLEWTGGVAANAPRAAPASPLESRRGH